MISYTIHEKFALYIYIYIELLLTIYTHFKVMKALVLYVINEVLYATIL